MDSFHIREDDLKGPAVQALLREHVMHMRSITPPESVHALDLNSLRAPEITFWSAWNGELLLGCGALKELGPGQGELKSMHTAQAHRGQGVASRLLQHIIQVALARGYSQLNLETGAMEEFESVVALYERHGFQKCGPFGQYQADPNSVFMTKSLS